MTLLERDEQMREEGREEERVQTKLEAARADAAEKRADAAENRVNALEKELMRTKAALQALRKNNEASTS